MGRVGGKSGEKKYLTRCRDGRTAKTGEKGKTSLPNLKQGVGRKKGQTEVTRRVVKRGKYWELGRTTRFRTWTNVPKTGGSKKGKKGKDLLQNTGKKCNVSGGARGRKDQQVPL